MSICNSCLQAVDIASCVDNIVIGTVTPSTNYYVYFENISTGNIQRLSATSNGAGLLTVDVRDLYFNSSNTYEVWVTLTTAANPDDKKMITICNEDAYCIYLRFKDVFDIYRNNISYTTQTLKTCDC